MDWTRTIFEVIDMRSFSNLWFWIAVAVLWSSASHWVLGVPQDMIARARRQPDGGALDDLEALVAINVRRILMIVRISGLVVTAFTAALLSALVVLGFWYRLEFAQAVLLLLGPMTLVGAMTVRTARRIEREAPDGPDLLRRLGRHRIGVQMIGVVSIFITAMWGMWHNLNAAVL